MDDFKQHQLDKSDSLPDQEFGANGAPLYITRAAEGRLANRILQKLILAGGIILDALRGITTPNLSFGSDPMAYAATITLDTLNAALHTTTTTAAIGNATINASSGGMNGQVLFVQITNDATAARTITFGTNFASSGTLVGVKSTTATVLFISNGTVFEEVARSAATATSSGWALKSYTTGTAVSNLSITGLSLSTDLAYRIVVEVDSLSAADTLIARINNDSTSGNHINAYHYTNSDSSGTITSGDSGGPSTAISSLAPGGTRTAYKVIIDVVLNNNGTNPRVVASWNATSIFATSDNEIANANGGTVFKGTDMTSINFIIQAGATGNFKVWVHKLTTS